MQTLETLKSKGQTSFTNLVDSAKERPDDVKLWGVTAGSAVVGAIAVNAAARGAIVLLSTLTAPPIAMTIGAVGGGYLGWQYMRERLPTQAEESATVPEPAVEGISIVTVDEPITPEPLGIEQDNLQKIKGIGPVYAERLQTAGIQTFAQLAELSDGQIREIIGPMHSGNMIEPESWLSEARQLATAGV